MNIKYKFTNLLIKIRKSCILPLIFLGVSIIVILFSINIKEHIFNREVYSYNTNTDLNYNVLLLPNSLFDTSTLGMNRVYVATLVDKINFNFKYKYNSQDLSNLQLKYSIKAYCHSYNDASKKNVESLIRVKEYPIEDAKTISVNSQADTYIDKDIYIDYPDFENQIDEFKSQTQVPCWSYVSVVLEVTPYKIVDGRPIGSSESISSTIPLDQKTFTISSEYQKFNNYQIMKYQNPQIYINYSLLILGIFLFSISIILFSFNYKKHLNKYYDKYEHKIKKILNKYSDIIIESTTILDESKFNVIMINSLDEMLILEQYLRFPIMHREVTKNSCDEFILINNKIIFKFTVNKDVTI